MPRAHRPRGLALGVATLAGVMALSACDGGGDPTAAPPSTVASTTAPATTSSSAPPTTATSSSPGYVPVKPSYPASAKKQTHAGAEAFVRYYFAAVDYAFTKPDAAFLAPLSQPSCKSCASLAAVARELKDRNEKYDSKTLEIGDVTYLLGDESRVRFAIELHQLKADRRRSDGSLVETDKDKALKRLIEVRWGEGEWRVSLIGS